MKEEFEDRIDAYLLNEMTEDERRKFEADAERNSELKNQLEFSRNVQMALKSRTEKLIAIKDWERRRENERQMKKRALRRRIYWSSSIAAVFIVGFFLFSTYRLTTPEPDMCPMPSNETAYAPRPQGASSVRGADAVTEELLAQGDYKGALNHIEEMEVDIETELYAYEQEGGSGSVERYSKQDENAKKSSPNVSFRGKKGTKDLRRGLEKEEEITEEEMRAQERKRERKQEVLKHKKEEMLWLKALALIGLNRKVEAMKLLDEIRKSESEYKEQADSLYNTLRE